MAIRQFIEVGFTICFVLSVEHEGENSYVYPLELRQ